MEGDRAQVKKGIEELGEKIHAKSSEDMKAYVQKLLNKGALPQEVLGFSDVMVEGMYGQAYRLYNTGKYREAIELFRMLTLINVQETKYLMGLAASFHMLKEYKKAVDVYTMCTLIDEANPIPYFHLSDCFMQIDDNASALIALEMAIKRATKPEYQTLKDRALLTCESLKNEINKRRSL